jgi:hypothetical protein
MVHFLLHHGLTAVHGVEVQRATRKNLVKRMGAGLGPDGATIFREEVNTRPEQMWLLNNSDWTNNIDLVERETATREDLDHALLS